MTLEDYLRVDGVRYLKVKVAGDAEADIARLTAIAGVIDRAPQKIAISLDGNEQYREVAAFADLMRRIRGTQGLERFYDAVLFVEQPLTRDVAMAAPIPADAADAIGRPLIIDEADGWTTAFREAIDLGYRGVSHKNCKGVYRSLINLALARALNRRAGEERYFLSAEDLTNLPVVPLQADLAVVATLGIRHVERNGHHYFRGLDPVPESERAQALARHPDLYERHGDTVALRIEDGDLAVGSLQVPGLGVADPPDMAATIPEADWHFDMLTPGGDPMTDAQAHGLPERFEDEAALEEFMSRPTEALSADLAAAPGDITLLGVGGKMGPTLARMAKRADPERRVIGVARFSNPDSRRALEAAGVETVACDLLDRDAVEALEKTPNVVFMAGMKFGATGNEPLTWAMNAHVPAIVAEAFRDSRIVAFSTACVYPYVDVRHQGATEAVPPVAPPGEYANSCVGRERMFQYFFRPPRHAGPADPVELRHRHALWRAARHRPRRPGGRADPARDGPCQRDLAGRRQCLRASGASALRHAVGAAQRLRTGGGERPRPGGGVRRAAGPHPRC